MALDPAAIREPVGLVAVHDLTVTGLGLAERDLLGREPTGSHIAYQRTSVMTEPLGERHLAGERIARTGQLERVGLDAVERSR